MVAGDDSDREAAEAVRALIPEAPRCCAGRTGLVELAVEDRPRRGRERFGTCHLTAAVGSPVVGSGPTHEGFGFTNTSQEVAREPSRWPR